jgi:phage gp36-like protein
MTIAVQSSGNAYCTPAQLLSIHDWNDVADLLSDKPANADFTTSYKLTKQSLTTNADLDLILKAASGKIESACAVGGKYTPDDLNALAGTVSGALLVELTADIAMWTLWNRKQQKGDLPQRCQIAFQWLDELAKGERLFGTLDSFNAAHLRTSEMTAQDVRNRNGRVWQARRYYGRRADMHDPW